MLERRGAILPDAGCCWSPKRFRNRDWRTAATRIDAVEHDQLFAFAAPILRAWLAIGSGQGDALAALPAEGGQGVGAAYADEQRPLIMLALGRPGAAAALVRAANSAGPRAAPGCRIAGAAMLARRGDRDGALALLEGDAGPIVAARAPDPGAPPGPRRDRTTPTPAWPNCSSASRSTSSRSRWSSSPRCSPGSRTWLAPDNSESLDGHRRIARAAGQGAARRAVARPCRRGRSVRRRSARDQRIRILLDAGDRDAALADALAATRAPAAATTDWVRLGEVYGAMGRQADAADGLRPRDRGPPRRRRGAGRMGAAADARRRARRGRQLARGARRAAAGLSARARAALRAQLSRLCRARSATKIPTRPSG